VAQLLLLVLSPSYCLDHSTESIGWVIANDPCEANGQQPDGVLQPEEKKNSRYT
jgi:hypothetical protein